MRVARSVAELEPRPRTVVIGTFDGVHLGHRRVIAAAGPAPTVVTFDPHPRIALGNWVPVLSTLERRLELLEALGVAEVLVVRFDLEVARLAPEEFVEGFLHPLGTERVVVGEGFRFGHRRAGDVELLRRLGLEVEAVELLGGVSSTDIRHLILDGDVVNAARLLGRPVELDGVVVAGDARGGTLGFPTANFSVPPELIVPRFGIYAGAALDHRAAVSIGTNPHYGGDERRVEAFLLDFEGDLYGRRVVVELWQRLRDERAFENERALVDQIARDVEETRRAARPV